MSHNPILMHVREMYAVRNYQMLQSMKLFVIISQIMPVNANNLMCVRNGDKIFHYPAHIPCLVQQIPTLKNVELDVITLVTLQSVTQPSLQVAIVMMEW